MLDSVRFIHIRLPFVYRLLLVLVIGLAHSFAFGQDESDKKILFDHRGIGFDLEGAHTVVPCESCHIGQRFRGTPRECQACHSLNGLIEATAKSATHIATSDDCASCHTTTVWNDIVRVDHTQTIGACETCHNDILAGGKSENHVFTNEPCDVCHSDLNWTPALFDHTGISSGCAFCHNGVVATGKNIDHIPSNDSCEFCHSTLAWQPAFVDHSAVVGACSNCHNGIVATGKNADHVPTSAECDRCHATIAWVPAGFDHSTTSANCSSCHNGVISTGKSVNHFVTAQECDRCHSTSSWLADVFVHATPNYPGDHAANLPCRACHTGNSQVVPWPVAVFQPNCGACHAADYLAAPHVKLTSPLTNYNVAELQDCSGACHIYEDETFSTILFFNEGNHRVSDSGF